ncbi:MAG: SIS domain-containing protein [Planctomycetota bacterium]|nr:SIS domain-containing protein [Planctomycetota bacterium]
MTELRRNIETQPGELLRTLRHTLGPGREDLRLAARLVREARHVYITGIGSSWHAGMAVAALFEAAGRPVHLVDASELLHAHALPRQACIVALSRSGKSVEIVELLEKAARAGARVAGITNTPESPLAERADAVLRLEAAFDHNISIAMYSALTLAGGLLAEEALGRLDEALARGLERALEAAPEALRRWSAQIEDHPWFAAEAPAYFLARGAGLAAAHETRLLWEEGAKAPACAMTTGGFRHGPQEMLAPGVRLGIWIHETILRDADLALAADARNFGAKVLLIGRGLPREAGDLVLEPPAAPPRWSFLLEILPGQLAAERLARLRGVDCDEFRICPYIIQAEGGLA